MDGWGAAEKNPADGNSGGAGIFLLASRAVWPLSQMANALCRHLKSSSKS